MLSGVKTLKQKKPIVEVSVRETLGTEELKHFEHLLSPFITIYTYNRPRFECQAMADFSCYTFNIFEIHNLKRCYSFTIFLLLPLPRVPSGELYHFLQPKDEASEKRQVRMDI